jgi:hypothetical protein
MGGCCAGVVDFVGAIIVGKTHSNGLVDTKQVPEEVPSPWIFCCLEISLTSLDEDGSKLVETSKLTRSTRSPLQPNNQRNTLVLPR